MMNNILFKLAMITLLFQLSLQAKEKEIVIDISSQKAYAMEDGYIVFEGRISTGKKGRETPNGIYSIMQKKRHHVSNLWPKPSGGAKMPYMMRLTNSGIAMHQGYVARGPASHGCIRLGKSFARKMYKWARVGTTVYVEGDLYEYYEYSRPIRGGKSNRYKDDYAVIESDL